MANEFKRDIGKRVPKSDAKKWIEKYDNERKKDTTSVFYGRDAIENILADQTVTGISFFFCRKPKKDSIGDIDDLVLLGTKEDGSVVWGTDPEATSSNTADKTGAYNNGLTCPITCPTTGS